MNIVSKNNNLIIKDEVFDSNYILVYILKYVEDNNTLVIIKESEDSPVVFKIKYDGFYTICRVTIPLDESKPYYYSNGKYYHNVKEVSLQELININPNISEIETEYFYHFSVCNLKKCFINICLDIFNLNTSICNLNLDSFLIYKRDLLWSALNIILYMADLDLMEEALRLLERITECNGLCSQTNNNCGCRR